jgi:hypothetical protein
MSWRCQSAAARQDGKTARGVERGLCWRGGKRAARTILEGSRDWAEFFSLDPSGLAATVVGSGGGGESFTYNTSAAAVAGGLLVLGRQNTKSTFYDQFAAFFYFFFFVLFFVRFFFVFVVVVVLPPPLSRQLQPASSLSLGLSRKTSSAFGQAPRRRLHSDSL